MRKIEESKIRLQEKIARERALKIEEYKKQMLSEIELKYVKGNEENELPTEGLSPESKRLVEDSQYKNLAEQARQRRMELDINTVSIRAAEQALTDYYQALRKIYIDYPSLRDQDYDFLEAAQPVIEASEYPELERDRILAAAVYANNFNVRIEDAYLNFDIYRAKHEQILASLKPKFTNKNLIVLVLILSVIIFVIIWRIKSKKEL